MEDKTKSFSPKAINVFHGQLHFHLMRLLVILLMNKFIDLISRGVLTFSLLNITFGKC